MKTKWYGSAIMIMVLLVGAFVMVAAQDADAFFKLDLTAGANTVVIQDNMGGDIDPTVGLITYSGTVGANWNINVTIGSSKPFLGSADNPMMNITSLNATSTAGGTLTIMLTDTDFTGVVPGFFSSLNGTLVPGSISLDTYYDNGNGEFALTTQVGNIGPLLGPAPVGDTDSGLASVTPPYSLTMVSNVVHTAGGDRTTFDATISGVPEPSTLLLLGFGLAGVAGFAWRRKKKQS
jgi:hypothetical protein